MEFVPTGTKIDFVGKRKIMAAISALMVTVSILLFVVKGPNWGIDFTGGTEIQLGFDEALDAGELRGALESVGLDDATVQAVGSDSKHYLVRVQDPHFGTGDAEGRVKQALDAEFGAGWVSSTSLDAQIGAKVTVVHTGEAVPLARIEAAIRGLEGAQVQAGLDDNTVYVTLPGIATKVEDAVRTSLAGKGFQVLQVDSVGPKVGSELRSQGFVAIFATLALVLVYVGFRFDMTFAPGAVIAVFHDVIIVTGFLVLTGDTFDLSIVGALLTTLGVSLNDTIVIFDRIRENMGKFRRSDLLTLINTSVNETLSRTIYTNVTTVMAMTVFLFMGGPVIQTFAKAMIVGVFVGTYSTVYIASPVIVVMEDLKPTLARLFGPNLEKIAGAPQETQALTQAEQRRRERQEKGAST